MNVAVCGEALIDVVQSPNGDQTELPGGSSANTAVALARLGIPVELITRLGDDDDGRWLRKSVVFRRAISSSHDRSAPAMTSTIALPSKPSKEKLNLVGVAFHCDRSVSDKVLEA